MKRPMTSGSAIPSMNRAVGQKERLRLELWLSNDASRLNLPPYVDVLGLTLSSTSGLLDLTQQAKTHRRMFACTG